MADASPGCTEALLVAVARQGYAYHPAFSGEAGGSLAVLSRALGPLFVPAGVDGMLATRPSADASYLSPFDRSEGIGWHNDFSTHADRPALSLAYLERVDPRGPEHGAWRVASCDGIVDQLEGTIEGREILGFLLRTDLPYSFTGEGDPVFLRAVERRGAPPGRLGFRFYGRAMRDGARLAHGGIPDDVEKAIAAVEAAADRVGHVLAAPAGALLVTDNWHALHDRLSQTVEPGLPLRRSLLCFVAKLHAPSDQST